MIGGCRQEWIKYFEPNSSKENRKDVEFLTYALEGLELGSSEPIRPEEDRFDIWSMVWDVLEQLLLFRVAR